VRCGKYLASWWTIAGVIVFCLVWWILGLSMPALTAVLSVLAITMSQIILREADRDTVAMEKKLDELIRATDKADDALVGLEKKI
jgi:low affinity Fe/Cu permease